MPSRQEIECRRRDVLRLRRLGWSAVRISRRLGHSYGAIRNDVRLLAMQGLCEPVRRIARSRPMESKADVPEPDYSNQSRQPGEAACRCAWCGRWRCGHYFEVCAKCQRWYGQASAGMPSRVSEWEDES